MRKALALQAVLVVLGLLTLTELLFSNVNTLLTSLESTAEDFGLSTGEERIRLLVLIALDGAAAVGSFAAAVGLRRDDPALFQRGLIVMLAGFLAYGTYQVVSARLQLAAEYTAPVTGAGVAYALIGVLAYVAGRRFVVDGSIKRGD